MIPQKKSSNESLFFPYYLNPNKDIPLKPLFTKIPIKIQFIIGDDDNFDFDNLSSSKYDDNTYHEIIIKHLTIEQFETGLKKIIQRLHKIYKDTVVALVDKHDNLSNLMCKGIESYQNEIFSKYSEEQRLRWANTMNYTMNRFYTLNQDSNICLNFKNFNSKPIECCDIKTLSNFPQFANQVYDAFHLRTFQKDLTFSFVKPLLYTYKIGELENQPKGIIKGSIENSDDVKEQPMHLVLSKSFKQELIKKQNTYILKAAIMISAGFKGKLPKNLGYDAIEKKFISLTIMRKMEETSQIETPIGRQTLTQTGLPKDINRHISSYLTMGN